MITAIIQSRMGSTRLPGKAMRLLAGKPMLQHVVERVSACPSVRQVIVATTDKPDDAPIRLWCLDRSIACIGWTRVMADGHNDVLGRYARAAILAHYDVLMRVTGDCPLWRPDLGEEVARAFFANSGCDLASNVHPDVDGFDTEIFTKQALQLADVEAQSLYDRQHVTPFLYRMRHVVHVDHRPMVGGLKLSVDTEKDLLNVERMMKYNP